MKYVYMKIKLMFYVLKLIFSVEKEPFSKYLLGNTKKIPMSFGTVVYERLAKSNRLKFQRRVNDGMDPSLDLLLTIAHYDLVATHYQDKQELKNELSENIKLLLLAYIYIDDTPINNKVITNTNNGENDEANLQERTKTT
ncbi:MAG: hypothetical protein CMF69_00475 [Magnetovibrio sp.]|nr:hypothetical protein [Magnetovibrio sp.]